ncbi:uncharacterized protein FOBCDRAFT_27195 [Fusarium oxysporum Fo47]|uniref:uncharacterized protein n=1 Tax=Fusarium oxysporum Fo47 TaxID=660027 RepID=UPI0028699F25|nr:uncharacterized protein FOBCDRAFT_27195 [Fusarium oxysporum Fo47]WJG35127.1 hypothetical protein FOBCDRAFT_27195 [Fusarium oxysporum Fo47]
MVGGAALSFFFSYFFLFLIPYLLVLSLEIPQIIPYSFRLQKFIIYQVMAQLMININQSFDSPKQDMCFPVRQFFCFPILPQMLMVLNTQPGPTC